MCSQEEARHALERAGMIPGLTAEEVDLRIGRCLRLTEVGHRALAFYLVEMADRRLYAERGSPTLDVYAARHHALDARRTRELLRVGRLLLRLPGIDRAFCAQEIGWSKVLLLLRVATPEHEAAWLAKARELSCTRLALLVRLHRPGEAPRTPDRMKGTPEVRFPLRVTLDPATHAKQQLAQEKLGAELGRAATVDDLQAVLLDLYLQMENDGKAPGWTHVPSSLYRVHLHPPVSGGGDDLPLFVETEAGLVPLDGAAEDGLEAEHRSACARCDGETVDGAHAPVDPPTPAAMRRRVLARDGGRCRCCGARRRLHVHHIEYRATGGRTKVYNLLTLCARCHALVHAGLLRIRGSTQKKARFVDGKGRPLHREDGRTPPRELLRLQAPPPADRAAAHVSRPAEPIDTPETLDALPERVDGAWWRRRADRIRCRADQTLVWCPEAPLREEPPRRPVPPADEAALDGLVGQDALRARLETEVRGSRALDAPFPHLLLTGPPGTGKTTLATALAARLGARLVRRTGSLLTDVVGLVRLLAALRPGDVLFLDEVHAVPQAVLETLYEALDDGRLTLTLHQGAQARTVVLELPRFTLVAATTQPSDLPRPLRTRAQLREHLDRYADEELRVQVEQAVGRTGLSIDRDAARLVARHARGIPREALRLAMRGVALAASQGSWRLDRRTAATMLGQQGFDAQGLKRGERRYLDELQRHGAGISLARLAELVGRDPGTVAAEIEPELVARRLVRITERGRVPVRRLQLRSARGEPGNPASAGRRTFAAGADA